MGYKINLSKFRRQESKEQNKKIKEQQKFEQRISMMSLETRPTINYFLYCDDGSKHVFANVSVNDRSMKYSKMCKKCGFEALLWMSRSSNGHKGFRGCQNSPSRLKDQKK